MAVGGAHVYVLTAERLTLYDRRFREAGSHTLRGATHLAFSDTTLAVVEPTTIRFYDVASSGHLEQKAAHEVGDVVDLESATLAGSRDAFFLRRGGRRPGPRSLR